MKKPEPLISVVFHDMFKIEGGMHAATSPPTEPEDMTLHELMVCMNQCSPNMPALSEKKLRETIKKFNNKILVLFEFPDEHAEYADIYIYEQGAFEFVEVREGSSYGPKVTLH